jgi:NAD(P)-dependent dehydrogenase (short-subunit alcohol dehydrogenase family)
MGRLAAQRWADAGGIAAVADVDEKGLRSTATGYDAIRTWPVDVSDARQVAYLVKEVESELGPIERVYNAAAIQPTP